MTGAIAVIPVTNMLQRPGVAYPDRGPVVTPNAPTVRHVELTAFAVRPVYAVPAQCALYGEISVSGHARPVCCGGNRSVGPDVQEVACFSATGEQPGTAP